MKFRLIIDKTADEEIIAIVHGPSSLTQQIENLICQYAGTDSIMGIRDDEMRKLPFSDIECITVLDRKIIAIDSSGQLWLTNTGSNGLTPFSAAVWMQYFSAVTGIMFPGVVFLRSDGGMRTYEKFSAWLFTSWTGGLWIWPRYCGDYLS